MSEQNLYNVGYDMGFEDGFKEAQPRVKELEAKLAKAVEAFGVLADDTNWFDAIEEDGTFSPAWRGTGSPEQIARTTLAELTGGKDE